jgi:hypothetical protein
MNPAEEAELVQLLRMSQSSLISPRRLNHEADKALKQWGSLYRVIDKLEISQETGYKQQNLALMKARRMYSDIAVLDYEKSNAAIIKMPLYYREFIHRHYVLDDEKKMHKNGRTLREYCKYIQVAERTYGQDLNEAKQLFIACGGI